VNRQYVRNPSPSEAVTLQPSAIEIRGLRKSFEGQAVLDGISVHVKRGETLVVLGRSGAGKSVLLKLLIGLQRADSGSIRILNHEITSLNSRDLSSIRKRIGFSFQYSALFDSLTAEQNVEFPLAYNSDLTRTQRLVKVLQLLKTVGMEASSMKLPGELSGGMRKRVGIARALALDPDVLLFDEPTAGLDPITARGIDGLIQQLANDRRITSIVVTHDLRSARRIADSVILLNKGRLQFEGSFDDLTHSQDPFVMEFLASS